MNKKKENEKRTERISAVITPSKLTRLKLLAAITGKSANAIVNDAIDFFLTAQNFDDKETAAIAQYKANALSHYQKVLDKKSNDA